MPQSNVDLLDNIDANRGNEPPMNPGDKVEGELTPQELRELARILHEMMRRELAMERNRLGR